MAKTKRAHFPAGTFSPRRQQKRHKPSHCPRTYDLMWCFDRARPIETVAFLRTGSPNTIARRTSYDQGYRTAICPDSFATAAIRHLAVSKRKAANCEIALDFPHEARPTKPDSRTVIHTRVKSEVYVRIGVFINRNAPRPRNRKAAIKLKPAVGWALAPLLPLLFT